MGNTTLTPKPSDPGIGAQAARGEPAPRPVRTPAIDQSAIDQSRVLRLTENVGSMGHWYKNLDTGEVTWSSQI